MLLNHFPSFYFNIQTMYIICTLHVQCTCTLCVNKISHVFTGLIVPLTPSFHRIRNGLSTQLPVRHSYDNICFEYSWFLYIPYNDVDCRYNKITIELFRKCNVKRYLLYFSTNSSSNGNKHFVLNIHVPIICNNIFTHMPVFLVHLIPSFRQ